MSILEVRVHGRTVNTYYHEGKAWIEGRKGSPYTIFFRNSASYRRKIIVSVDGLNIMTGKSDWDRGYLVNGWDSIEIPGWRHDGDTVHQFEFSSLRDSYNQHNESGAEKNIGVIGCMVFDERAKNVWRGPGIQMSTCNWPSSGYVPCSYQANYMLNAGAQNHGVGSSEPLVASGASVNFTATADCAPQNSLGTGYGQVQTFHTHKVEFDAQNSPSETLLLYYDDLKGLERRGIVRRYVAPVAPSAFPGWNDGCPPPR